MVFKQVLDRFPPWRLVIITTHKMSGMKYFNKVLCVLKIQPESLYDHPMKLLHVLVATSDSTSTGTPAAAETKVS